MGNKYLCVAMRGRVTDGNRTRQQFEIRGESASLYTNTITTLFKDNLLLEKDGNTMEYKVRKFTPKECFRLMNLTEKDAEAILAVNSNTQCYKIAGNSIIVSCLLGIFSQLGLKGVRKWNELPDKEKEELVWNGCYHK